MLSSLTNPVTGAAQTGFTSPTYSHSSDAAPNAHSEQVAVTTLGGTQGSASAHSVSSPFTITVERPANLRQVGVPNPVTGTLGNVPRNVYKVRVRKGMVPLSGQSARTGQFSCEIAIPAGADTAAPDDVRAMFSAAIGTLSDLSAELGDLGIDGILGA